MNNEKKKISFKPTVILLIVLSIVFSSSNAIYVETISNNNFTSYINISVGEAWELLRNTSNGIQYPIDVRTYNEWLTERIDTPYPEYARLNTLSDLQTINGYNNFKSLYLNEEVIVYCRSGMRSASAAQYLVSNEFNGTIYNMLGGITAWNSAGYPIKNNNEIPDKSEISTDSTFYFTNITCFFNTTSIDPDDDVIRYGWDWNGDDTIDEWSDYFQSGEIIRTSYKWLVAGDYDIKVLVEDIVGEKSDFSEILTINISNLPPDKPEIYGTTSGKKGQTYSFNFSSLDPNGDNIYIMILWYDNYPDAQWDGPYYSSEIIMKNYSWAEDGIYNIQVKSKDIYGDESEWNTLEVTMPKQKIFNQFPKILLWLFEQFPFLQPYFQHF